MVSDKYDTYGLLFDVVLIEKLGYSILIPERITSDIVLCI